jgi:DNA-binding IclR family transcriptional regulator
MEAQERDAADAGVLATGLDKGSIRSIDRAAQVLTLLDQDTTELSPAIVAERLGLNRTTAHRYLLSLQAAGFLTIGNGPGPLLDQLSTVISLHRPLIGLAPDVLRSIADDIKMSAVLGLPGRFGPVVRLVEEVSTSGMFLTVRPGTVLGPETSQARVILAFGADRETLARYHQGLSAERRRAEEQGFERVRRDGIAWADLGPLGLAGVAAPVLREGAVAATVAIIGTDRMLSPDEPDSPAVQRLRAAAAELTGLLAG